MRACVYSWVYTSSLSVLSSNPTRLTCDLSYRTMTNPLDDERLQWAAAGCGGLQQCGACGACDDGGNGGGGGSGNDKDGYNYPMHILRRRRRL